jgi:glycosyltransferase involved in cell wall biosynthesis
VSLIAVDAVGIKSGGGARTLVDLLGVLDAAPGVDRVRVFVTPRARRTFDIPAGRRWAIEERPAEDGVLRRRLWWYVRGLAGRCAAVDADVLLAMNGMGSHPGHPTISFVMQSLPYWGEAMARLPISGRLRMATIGALTRRSCRQAVGVYTQSAWMVGLLARSFGLAERRFRLAPPGTAPFPAGDAPKVTAALSAVPFEQRVLFVGGDAPHKNLDLLVAGVEAVRTERPGVTLFATIGSRSRFSGRTSIVPLGELDRGELRTAYASCAVTVQASIVECAGLVPAEAMACGCPVIVPDRPWAREVCGSDALYFDANDTAEFARQLSRVLSDTQLRSAMVAATRRFRSPGDVGAGYLGLVEHLVGLAGGGGL